MAVHASGRSKHSAVPWRPEMDAFVLLRHVRDGISLPKVAEQWPFESATKRSKDAIKWRWKKVLKRLDALDDLRLICGSCDERDEPETQLNSTEVSLRSRTSRASPPPALSPPDGAEARPDWSALSDVWREHVLPHAVAR